jgi:hypothetical protein
MNFTVLHHQERKIQTGKKEKKKKGFKFFCAINEWHFIG